MRSLGDLVCIRFFPTIIGSVCAVFRSYYYLERIKLETIICKRRNTLVSFLLLAHSSDMPNVCVCIRMHAKTISVLHINAYNSLK